MKTIRITKIVVEARPNEMVADCVAEAVTHCMEKATDILLVHEGQPIAICYAALCNFVKEYNKAVPESAPIASTGEKLPFDLG